MNLYEILKAAKMGTGAAPDMYTALMARNLQLSKRIHQLSGVPPLTFKANGEPLIDWSIYGNMEHSGTPTPDNPIYPSECGERTENLWDNLGFSANTFSSPGVHTTTNSYGTTLSTSTGGSVEITQIASGGNINYQNGFFFIEIDSSQFAVGDKFVIGFDYEITNKLSTVNTTVAYVGQQSTASGVIADWSKSGRAVIPVTLTNAMIYPYVEVRLCGNSINVTNVQNNRGSTALPYEPYGYKIPISSANTTTPVYLGEVPTTRRIKKLVFTGDEDWSYIAGATSYSAYYRVKVGSLNSVVANAGEICTHYQQKTVSSSSTDIGFSMQNSTGYNGAFVAFRPYATSSESELITWKSYLAAQYAAGTPVTVWYVLATETTGIVNEPIRKIGDYADSVSAQEGISIPTIKGNNTLDVDTTLQPSRVDIKYYT